MLRKFIFKYGEGSEYILPISPKSFKVDYGIRVETVNIHTMGDVNIAGYSTLSTISIDCMFPSKKYPFVVGTYHGGTDCQSFTGKIESLYKIWQKAINRVLSGNSSTPSRVCRVLRRRRAKSLIFWSISPKSTISNIKRTPSATS